MYFSAKSMESIRDIPTTSTVLTAHPFSKCTNLTDLNTKSTNCQQYLAPPKREFHSSESLNCNFTNGNHKAVEFKPSMEIPCQFRGTNFNKKSPQYCIRHSKSLNSLNDDLTTNSRSLHKEYKSFNNLIEEEDYVIHSIYYSRTYSADVNGYLKLLPDCNDYEEIDDMCINIEPDYCSVMVA